MAARDPRAISEGVTILTDVIFFQKLPIENVLDRINATAVHQIDSTRAVCLVLHGTIQALGQKDTQLCSYIKNEVTDRAISTYINYWKDVFSDTPHSDVGGAVYNKSDLRRDGIDPVAVTAYIGDLYGLGYVTTKILKTCVGYMLDNFTSLLHVRCIDVLFERAYAHYPVRGLDTPYLFHCLGVIRRRSRQVFGKEMSSEEDILANIIHRLLSGANGPKKLGDGRDPSVSESKVEDIRSCTTASQGHHDNSDSDTFHHHQRSDLTNAPREGLYYYYERPKYEGKHSDQWDAIYNSPDPEDLPPIESFF